MGCCTSGAADPDVSAQSATEPLDFSGGELTDGQLIAYAKKKPGATELDINNNPDLTDYSIIEISKVMKALKKINIANCNGITQNAIDSLVENCGETLEKIWISNNQKFTSSNDKVIISVVSSE